MVRRTVTALLWLFSIWTVGGALSVYAGVPSLAGPVVGAAVAGLIWWDPSGRLWKPRPSAAARRRLADLARVSATANAAETQRKPEVAQG